MDDTDLPLPPLGSPQPNSDYTDFTEHLLSLVDSKEVALGIVRLQHSLETSHLRAIFEKDREIDRLRNQLKMLEMTGKHAATMDTLVAGGAAKDGEAQREARFASDIEQAVARCVQAHVPSGARDSAHALPVHCTQLGAGSARDVEADELEGMRPDLPAVPHRAEETQMNVPFRASMLPFGYVSVV